MTLIHQKVRTFIGFAVCVDKGCSPWGKVEKRDNLLKKRFKEGNMGKSIMYHVNNNFWIHFKYHPSKIQLLGHEYTKSQGPKLSPNSIEGVHFTVKTFDKGTIWVAG